MHPPPLPPPPQQQQQKMKKPLAARVDTQELRAQLIKRVGSQRAELYFRSLKRFLDGELGKEEFDRIVAGALGKENVKLHNLLVKGILHNAYTAEGPPPSRRAPTGNSQTSTVSNGALNSGSSVLAVRRMRAVTTPRERRFADKPSPLGKSPLGHPGAGETGSRSLVEVISVEDGEEVDQAWGSPLCVQSRSPIRAPLGVTAIQNFQPLSSSDVCYHTGELPDSELLSKVLEEKLKGQGLSVPRECADVLNSGLNEYLGQMLKACLGVAKARGNKARMCPPIGASSSSAAAAASASAGKNGFPVGAGSSYQASSSFAPAAAKNGFPGSSYQTSSSLAAAAAAAKNGFPVEAGSSNQAASWSAAAVKIGFRVEAGSSYQAASSSAAATAVKNGLPVEAGSSYQAAASSAAVKNGFPVEAGSSYQASLLDLWTAVQSNSRLVRFTQQREKIASHLLNR